MKRLILLTLILAAASGVVIKRSHAVELLRGPYLQIATSTNVTIRWRTDVPTDSLVSYGVQPNNLSLSTRTVIQTNEHIVSLSALSPATSYFYSIGSTTQIFAKGRDYQFVTAPAAAQATSKRIWAIGDSGAMSVGITDVLSVRDAYSRYAGARRTDVWLLLGDIAYDFGTDEEFQVGFFDVFKLMLRQIAPWPTIGNHETYSVPVGQPFPYLDIFSLPRSGQAGGVPSGTENYYSFNYGNIHFICLDSMTEIRATNGAMANWLRADVAASTNQWKIAFWHHTSYSKGSHDSDAEIEMIEMRNLLPILEENGVDLVLTGHSHNYERSYLLHGHYGYSTNLSPEMILDQGSGRVNDTGAYIKPTSGPLANQGTVYVVAGSASACVPPNGHHPVMFMEELELGSLVIDINSNRLDAVFLRETGAIDDSFTIIKGAPEPLRLCPSIVQQGKVITRWKSMRGLSYRVEYADNFHTQNWQPLSDIVVATGATTAVTNDIPTGVTSRFYRVIEISP